MQAGVGMGSGVRNFWIMQDVNYNVKGIRGQVPNIYIDIDELVQTGVGIRSGVRNFWIMQDVNYNVMGVLSDGPAGVGPRLVERYEYTPYGRRTVFSHGFLAADFNGDGTVDDADYTIYGDSYGDTGLRWFQGDGNGDGTVDSADYTVWADQYGDSVPTSAGNDPHVMQPRLESFRGYWPWGDDKPSLCDVGHQGLLYDREIDGYYNRMRMYLPRAGRFAQRDPIGYADGMSLYQYVGGRPVVLVDPTGLIPGSEWVVEIAYELWDDDLIRDDHLATYKWRIEVICDHEGNISHRDRAAWHDEYKIQDLIVHNSTVRLSVQLISIIYCKGVGCIEE